MRQIKEEGFTGERALFAEEDLTLCDCVFYDGESPLKESRGIRLDGCIFKWKYPLWYSSDVKAVGTTLLDTARSGIWYTKGIEMVDCTLDSPKTFRRSEDISLTRVIISNAQETLWSCKGVKLSDVTVRGDYFGMNSSQIEANRLNVSGNYAFDGAKDVVVRNSTLISKDAFWNCENVTVEDSLIIGEYLGWNSKNVRLVNCRIESNQGMCYMDGVTLENCKLVNTDLAFEYSKVQADVKSSIVSIKNPTSGRILAEKIGEIIMEENRVDTSLTEIAVKEG